MYSRYSALHFSTSQYSILCTVKQFEGVSVLKMFRLGEIKVLMALITNIMVCLECDVALFSRLLRNFRMNLAVPFALYEIVGWHLSRATGRKEGRKEGGKQEGSKEGREGGRKEGRREGRREGREGRKEGGKEGVREGRREGSKERGREGRKQGRKEGVREGRMEEGK